MDRALERAVDWVLGLSVLFWAALAVSRGHGETVVGATVVALNAVAGCLFLFRRIPLRRGNLGQTLACMASVPISAAALAIATPVADWPNWATALFAIGGVGAAFSLATLGSSFGVLPACRGVVVRGPFRVVRHPAYLCELLMVLACALASSSPLAVATFGGAVALVALRVVMEERVLARDAVYADYTRRVRFRLVPLLW